MKYEPLKGKTLLWNQITGDIETTDGRYFLETKTEDARFFRIFLKKDVKSAVFGLLQEIENEKLNHISCKKDYNTGFYDGLDFAIERIKKWLPDLMKVDEQ